MNRLDLRLVGGSHLRVPNHSQRAIEPAGSQGLDARQSTRGVMENEIIADHDAGMGRERRQQRNEHDVADIDAVVLDRLCALEHEHLVKVETVVFPEAIRSCIISQMQIVVLREVVSHNRVAILLADAVLEADQVTVV